MDESHRHPYIQARNQRLDPVLYESTGQPVFITICAHDKSRPFDDEALADEVVECLLAERKLFGCEVYAYCLMSDHLHMLSCPSIDGKSVLTYVDRFKGKSTRIAWNHGIRGKLWQPRSYDRIVRREDSLLAIAEYILLNPVRQGLGEDYRWCGLLDPMPLG
jgi:REP element-mobilizing transposase RayT